MPGSAWHAFGARWFAAGGRATGKARRYGFHATLKPPFRLAPGRTVDELIAALDRFAAKRPSVILRHLEIATLRDYLAVVPRAPHRDLVRLASDCVVDFDEFRADVVRPAEHGLTERQLEHLLRWGYPWVLDEFRFHLSLAGPLRGAPPPPPPALPAEPLEVDAVSVFEEPAPEADFRLVHRSPLRPRGRLVYVAGPSGAGKDSVLGWLQSKAPGSVAIARRYVTRPARPGELHTAVSASEFEAMRRRGAFAMHWHANGNSYGIGREIKLQIAAGRTVVVNGSREYLPQARSRFPEMEVVLVTASAPVLRSRLGARRRESAAAVAARLERNEQLAGVESAAVLEIRNEGLLDAAGRRLLDFLA